MLAVAVSLILPHLTKVSLLQIVIAMSGVLWFCYDLFDFLENTTRSNLRTFLNSLVLDDVLGAIYDPETGWIATMVGSFVGCSSMYSLGMSDEQKTRLVQASLLTSNEEAHNVLLNPGGCKTMLPHGVQTWLEGDIGDNGKALHLKTVLEVETVGDGDNSDTSSLPECGVANGEDNSISSDEPCFSPRARAPCNTELPPAANEQHGNFDTSQNAKKKAHNCTPCHGVNDSTTIMFSILRELAFSRMKPYIQCIPESALENVGMSATLALALQLTLRMRSKRCFLSSLSALAFSGLATGAFSTVLARHAVLGNIHDKESLQIVLQTIAMRIWEKLKTKAKGRWKGVLAMLVLIAVGKRSGANTPRQFKR